MTEDPVAITARKFLVKAYQQAIGRKMFSQCMDELRVGSILACFQKAKLCVEKNRAQVLLAPKRVKLARLRGNTICSEADLFGEGLAREEDNACIRMERENIKRELNYFNEGAIKTTSHVTFEIPAAESLGQEGPLTKSKKERLRKQRKKQREADLIQQQQSEHQQKGTEKGTQTIEIGDVFPRDGFGRAMLLQNAYLFLLKEKTSIIDFACCCVLVKLLGGKRAFVGYPKIQDVIERLSDLTGLEFNFRKVNTESWGRRDAVVLEGPIVRSSGKKVWEITIV